MITITSAFTIQNLQTQAINQSSISGNPESDVVQAVKRAYERLSGYEFKNTLAKHKSTYDRTDVSLDHFKMSSSPAARLLQAHWTGDSWYNKEEPMPEESPERNLQRDVHGEMVASNPGVTISTLCGGPEALGTALDSNRDFQKVLLFDKLIKGVEADVRVKVSRPYVLGNPVQGRRDPLMNHFERPLNNDRGRMRPSTISLTRRTDLLRAMRRSPTLLQAPLSTY